MEGDNKNYSSLWIIIVAVFVLFLIAKVLDPVPEVKMYDPSRTQAVGRSIEAADIHSGFTLTDEEVKEIAERTSLQELRKK